MTIWQMGISYWITKATDTHSEYVMLIALPRQQHLRKLSLMLGSYARCTYDSWILLEIRTLKYIQCKKNSEKDNFLCIIIGLESTVHFVNCYQNELGFECKPFFFQTAEI
jgi:hypothetical protein